VNKLIRLAAIAMAFAAPVTARATPVTWSFHQTSCVSGSAIPCVPPSPNFVLATLTLLGPTSQGSAAWDGMTAPMFSGDDFVFAFAFEAGYRLISQAFSQPPCDGGHQICDFDISWKEAAGQLTAVNIAVDGFHDSFGDPKPIGLTTGSIASDNVYGGCQETQCDVTGFWQSDLAVPEPTSAVLLTTGLIGLGWRLRREAIGRHRDPCCESRIG
jgi:hypothetical protein